ncbi:MAG: radical SAM protein [Thermoplasmata archaeon]|nr:MAG: radical SAM protein [Thermoplasmata archaeon]
MDLEYRPLYPKHVLDSTKNSLFKCSYIVSPYIGCEYNCVYCTGCIFREEPKEFKKTIQIKVNAPALIRKELKSAKKNLVCLKGYQPVEKEYRLTRKILEALFYRKFPVHIVTKSDMITKDIDILEKMSEEGFCTVTFILNTLDKDILKIFEPHAPSPKKRMKALESITSAGITAGIALSPIVPYITDSKEQLEEIIKRAAESKASYVMPLVLTLDDSIRPQVIDVIKRNFPTQLVKYRKLYEFGSSADVKYSRQLKSRLRFLLDKYSLNEEMPVYDAQRRTKQINIEEF